MVNLPVKGMPVNSIITVILWTTPSGRRRSSEDAGNGSDSGSEASLEREESLRIGNISAARRSSGVFLDAQHLPSTEEPGVLRRQEIGFLYLHKKREDLLASFVLPHAGSCGTSWRRA